MATTELNQAQTAAKGLKTDLKSLKNGLKEKAGNLKQAKAKRSGEKERDNGGLKLLIGIVSSRDAEKLTELCNSSCAALSYEADAKGTASSSVLDYLGLGETEKKLVLSLLPAGAEEATLRFFLQCNADELFCFFIPQRSRRKHRAARRARLPRRFHRFFRKTFLHCRNDQRIFPVRFHFLTSVFFRFRSASLQRVRNDRRRAR